MHQQTLQKFIIRFFLKPIPSSILQSSKIQIKTYPSNKYICKFNTFQKNIIILYQGTLQSAIPLDITKSFNVQNSYFYYNYNIGDIINLIEIRNRCFSLQNIYTQTQTTVLEIQEDIFFQYFYNNDLHQKQLVIYKQFKNIFLKKLLKQYQQIILQNVNSQEHNKNYVIFKEGDPNTHIYFVQEGQVSIYAYHNNKSHQLLKLNKGSFFGYSQSSQNLYQVRIKFTSTKLLAIDAKFFIYICNVCNPSFLTLFKQQLNVIKHLKSQIQNKQIKVRYSLNEQNIKKQVSIIQSDEDKSKQKNRLSLFYLSSIKSQDFVGSKKASQRNSLNIRNQQTQQIKQELNLFEYNKSKYNNHFKNKKMLQILKKLQQQKYELKQEYKQIKQIIKHSLNFYQINNLHIQLNSCKNQKIDILRALINKKNKQNYIRVYQSKKKNYRQILSISISQLKHNSTHKIHRKGTPYLKSHS